MPTSGQRHVGQHFTFGWQLPQIKCPLRQLKMGAARGTSKHTGHSIKLSIFSVVSLSIRYFCSTGIFLRFTGGEFGSSFELKLELEMGDSMELELLATITISSESLDVAGLAVIIRPELEGVKLNEERVALPPFLISRFSITKG